MKDIQTSAIFESDSSLLFGYVSSFTYPWEALSGIKEAVARLVEEFKDDDRYYSPEEGVLIAKNAKLAPNVTITAPAFIDCEAELRPGAFLRGGTMVGKSSVVGNSCELKNCILFDCVTVPHFNYVGDSILGYHAHMGAGAVTSNVKSDRTKVTVSHKGEKIETGLKKFGAILGDYVEVGCNSVLNPGTIVGKRSNVYPLSSVRGTVPAESIFKAQGNIVKKF